MNWRQSRTRSLTPPFSAQRGTGLRPPKTAPAPLRQWLNEAEANDEERGGRVRRTPPTVRPQGARAASPLVYVAEVLPMPVRPPTSETASTSV
jgi:hypothetical protein